MPQPVQPPQRPAVVLLNFGGPRRPEEVEGFLFEILRDPNTLQLPFPQRLQDALARRVARRRAPETARQYGEIGGASPIVADTERIAGALRQALADAGAPVPVYVAQRYLPGWTDAVAREVATEAPDAVLAVPLYPHFSYATTGSALEQLHHALRAAGCEAPLWAVRSYPDDPDYLAALGDRLEDTLRDAAPPPEATVVLCSAHGLPAAYVERGDPYRLELYRTLEPLRTRFAQWDVRLAFQSRVGPAEWLRPYTDEAVPALAAEGVRHVVFLPLSFVNDHIETLYEVQVTYFDLARRCGLEPRCVPAVSDHPGHVAALAGAVRRWLAGRGGVPATELLPPGQSFRRTGAYAWAAWAAALVAALVNALCR